MVSCAQALAAAWSWPSAFTRFMTLRFCTAWISAAIAWAKARTLARAAGSRGSSGGAGWVSSRYSQIASDWVRTAAVVEHQGRDQALRVQRQRLRRMLLAASQVAEAVLGGEALEVQRDAHPVGGRGPPIAPEDHGILPCASAPADFSPAALRPSGAVMPAAPASTAR